MKKEKTKPSFVAAGLRAWLIGALVAFLFCLLAGRILAGVFENTPKYEQLLSFACYGLLFVSGAAGGAVATALTGRQLLLHGTLASLVQLLLQLLAGLLLGNGLCSVGELALRAVLIVGGGAGASQLLVLSGRGRRKKKKTARKKRER